MPHEAPDKGEAQERLFMLDSMIRSVDVMMDTGTRPMLMLGFGEDGQIAVVPIFPDVTIEGSAKMIEGVNKLIQLNMARIMEMDREAQAQLEKEAEKECKCFYCVARKAIFGQAVRGKALNAFILAPEKVVGEILGRMKKSSETCDGQSTPPPAGEDVVDLSAFLKRSRNGGVH